jgi:hypothetical protein
VEYLTATWEQSWTAVFGSGGSGKIWSDFITAVSKVKTDLGIASTTADGAAGSALIAQSTADGAAGSALIAQSTADGAAGTALAAQSTADGAASSALATIDGIGQGILGDAAYASLQFTAKQSIRRLVGTLFGVSNPVLTEILAAAVPDLDGSIITTGTVDSNFLDTPGIGAAINPTSGSGATLTRTGTTPSSTLAGRREVGTGFYNTLSASSTITALTSGSQYTGRFQVSETGWYLCEISFLINPSAGYDWNVAPLLYKNGAQFRVGSDAMLVNAVVANAQRYTQSSFIVYLTAGQNVGAGYDASGAFANLFSGSGSAVDTYFSISLLNKTYA